MLVIAGYTFHSWELLGMWAWTPTFLAACFVAAGSELTRGAGLGAYMTALFHVTGMLAALLAGAFADRFGRTPVIFVMATVSALCSLGLRLDARGLARPDRRGGAPLRVRRARGLADLLDRDHRGGGAGLSRRRAGAALPPGLWRGRRRALVFGAILDWYGVRSAGAWGWAFLSLGIAGVGAVVSVVLLHRTPAAAALHGSGARRAPASAGAR